MATHFQDINGIEVFIDRLGTSIRVKGADKKVSAVLFQNFVGSIGLKPSVYLVFGDSLTDADAAFKLLELAQNTTFVYVGDKPIVLPKVPVIKPDKNKLFDEGVVNVLEKLRSG